MRLKTNTLTRLSQNEASLQLAGMAALTGILAGLVVNLFRLVLEAPFPLLGLARHADDFESLSPWLHFLLPLAGSILLALLFQVAGNRRHLGVAHVIDKVQNFQGEMPLRNAVLQFLGGATALLSGHSCGREGPAIHMGATSSSLLARWFHLPNNANRTLIACGSAAAIAASFNTPIAGVVFAMEVIMMEYSIAGFMPVIIAAVGGAVITQIFYGDEPVFVITDVGLNSLWELPYIMLMGIVIGVLAAAFVHWQKYVMSYLSLDLRKRLLLAGLLTGLVAVFIPEVMGMGYDTLNSLLHNQLALSLLLPLLAAKLLLTATILGLGVPGGVIGPTLMIGGVAGSLLGMAGDLILPGLPANPAFYTLLGMCAMMGAVLQAPLAALMAMLELSGTPNLILPAMLIIVVANLTSSEIFSTRSIFQMILQQQGIKTPKTLSRLLYRYGVSAILDTRIGVWRRDAGQDGPTRALAEAPRWIVLIPPAQAPDGHSAAPPERRLVAARSLDKALAERRDPAAIFDDLYNKAVPLASVSLQATLQEAMETLQNANADYAYVHPPLGLESSVLGIVSVDAIIGFYKDR